MTAIRLKNTFLYLVSISLISILVIGFVELSDSLTSKQNIPDKLNLVLNQTRDQFNRGFNVYSDNLVFQEKSRSIVEMDGERFIQQVLDNTFTRVTFLYTRDGDPVRIEFEKLKINGNFAFALTTIYDGKLTAWPFPIKEARSAEEAYLTEDPTWTSGNEVVVKCVKRDWRYTMEWKTHVR